MTLISQNNTLGDTDPQGVRRRPGICSCPWGSPPREASWWDCRMSRHCRTACTSTAGDCSAHAPPRVSRACSPRVVTTAHVVVCPSGRAHGRTAGTRPPVGRCSVKSTMTVTSNDQQNGKISFKSVVTRVHIERCNIQDHSIIVFWETELFKDISTRHSFWNLQWTWCCDKPIIHANVNLQRKSEHTWFKITKMDAEKMGESVYECHLVIMAIPF